MMKLKYIFLATFFWMSLQSSFAQRGVRVGYIDMDYILNNIPEYQEALSELNKKVEGWQSDLANMTKKVESMQENLDNEQVLLTKELIEEREEDIFYKEKEITEFKRQCFGPNGSLMVQKQILTQPIQDQVFNAVQQIAANKKFDFIFDKSADAVMLYSADRYDVSEVVLRSITRAYKTEQVKDKAAKRKAEQEAAKEMDMANPEVLERQKALEAKKSERQRAIDARKAERARIKAEKQKAYEARRQELLDMRKRKLDSLKAIIEANKLAKEKEELEEKQDE